MENRRKKSGSDRKTKSNFGSKGSEKRGGSRKFVAKSGGYGRNKFGGGSKKSGGRGRGKQKELDSKLFIKKAKPVKETKYNPDRTYNDFELHEKLKSSLALKGFEFPTEIQDKTIDQSVKGQDILGIANTGTGKTGAFLIPIIDRLLKEDRDFRTLVVVPTRELATQVQSDFQSMTRGFGLFSICLVGGTPTFKDVKKLRMKNHIVIGTPGRLIDMVKRKALKLEKTEILVLDEFDRMLDMGFVEDVRFLKKNISNLKQTMLFSATLDKKLKPIIDEIIQDPFQVLITSGGQSSDNVEQNIIKVERGYSKFDKLISMLNEKHFEKTLIFAETKRTVDMVSKNLKEAGIRVEYIHGDKTQKSREFSLKKFKDGRADVLVATDVAARGLDIKGITHVINYERPRDYDSYIHRIGRTGRAGTMGHAFTFI
jgi:ATP-dependent RNA helicase RhlE